MKTKLLILFTFCSFWAVAQVSQTERNALIALYNATNGDNWTNNTNWDTDPSGTSDIYTWYGISKVTHNDGVTDFEYIGIDLANNNLNGILDGWVIPELGSLDFSGNQLYGMLPDLSGVFPSGQDYYTSYYFVNNKFQFGDLEAVYPNYNVFSSNLTLNLSPQQNTSVPVDIEKRIGESTTLEALVSGTVNSYQWYKDDVLIAGATTMTLNLTNIQVADFGVYHCKITNSIVVDLTLTTGNFNLLKFEQDANVLKSLLS